MDFNREHNRVADIVLLYERMAAGLRLQGGNIFMDFYNLRWNCFADCIVHRKLSGY